MNLHPLYTSHVQFLPLLEHEIRVEVTDFGIRSAPRTVVLQFVVMCRALTFRFDYANGHFGNSYQFLQSGFIC